MFARRRAAWFGAGERRRGSTRGLPGLTRLSRRAPGWRALGRAGGETDGVAVLGVAHDLRGEGSLATEGAAELADDSGGASRRAFIQVDLLDRERGAPTVGAAVAIGLERTDTAPQENALE